MNKQENPNIKTPEVGDRETVVVIQNGRQVAIDYEVIRKSTGPDGNALISRQKVFNSEKDIGPAEIPLLPLEKVTDVPTKETPDEVVQYEDEERKDKAA